ncbi:Bromodomain protein, partial [Cooperia oncophora]
MEEYVCPSCTEAQTTQGYESASSSASSTHATLCRADYPLVWRLLECVADHRMSWPFRQPVSLEEFPNYLDVVEHPIDLSIIQQRLENLEYQRLKDFTRDMSRLFENARIFYPRDSNVYQCADTLEKIFEHALAEVRAEIEARVNGRKV